jgi:hypothetical protein
MMKASIRFSYVSVNLRFSMPSLTTLSDGTILLTSTHTGIDFNFILNLQVGLSGPLRDLSIPGHRPRLFNFVALRYFRHW